MDKRYQIFLSSTYADLKDERQRVIQTLMELDCIPAGMELFPALDEDQFQFIKRVIDDCDYYVLIIGGRYGSLSTDGISFTEKEYDYAISIGLKVIAFLHERPNELTMEKCDIDPALRQRLDDFRTKVATSRLVKFWTKADELPGMVALSLSKTMKIYPAVGWVRAGNVANDEILGEINELRKENDRLRTVLAELEKDEPPAELNLATMEESFDFKLSWYQMGQGRTLGRTCFDSVSATWMDIFAVLAPSLIQRPNDGAVNSTIAGGIYRRKHETIDCPSGILVVADDFETIRVQLKTIGLVDVAYERATNGSMGVFWGITTKGERLLVELRTVKSKLKS